MNKPADLTKTCTICGQRKPLSAFLQIIDTHEYGSVCASCRKAGLDQIPKEPEDSTRSTTGAKIDAKLKVKEAADNREIRKQVEEDYFEERENQDEKQVLHKEKVGSIAKDAKKHRSEFLEKRSFLNTQKPSTSSQPVFGGEAHKAAAGELNFKGPVDITRVAGTIKTTSSTFRTFLTRLGNAPIASALEKAVKQKNQNKAATPDPVSEYLHKNRGPGAK